MATYSDLRTAIINTTENDGTEFTAEIPNFISRSELRLTKDIDDSGLDEYSAITLTGGNAVVSLGDRVRIVRNVHFTTSASSIKTNLLQRTIEFCNDYWPVSSSTGVPRYYARKNNTSIFIVPTPTSTLTGEIQTVSQPLALASATGTSVTTQNYFSNYCYDALFYAAMMEATMYMKDWNTLTAWQSQYQAAVTTLRNQARRTRQDDMAVAASPAGGPDTLQQGTP